MLKSIKDLTGYVIDATDGNLGHVRNFFFDDERWTVRYLIVETGSWLFHRKVLISPIAVGVPNWSARSIPVSLSKQQVQDSPDIDTEKPVSRQHEDDYLRYYNYGDYWGGAGLWGVGMVPNPMMPGYVNNTIAQDTPTRADSIAASRPDDRHRHSKEDPHLRSCNNVIGYHIHASDGNIGHISDMLVDEKTWAIRYLIVNTGSWWENHTVLIATQWVDQVEWSDRHVTVAMTRQEIKDAPDYDANADVDRALELKTHQHYRREAYWLHEQDE
ncbi:uncharacterized protein YrrD [Oxalobacteraceae bacterium GrIS 2.11]